MTQKPVPNSVVEECGSTNDLARELSAAGVPHGTWISARRQTGGRGRLGREWQSLDGNLFLSIVLRVEEKSLWTWIPMAIAVGAAEELLRSYPQLASNLKIKWPNDLWIGHAKLGGILCEAIGDSRGSAIIAGIGLNVAQHPEAIDQDAASLSDTLNAPISVDSVRPRIIDGILRAVGDLISGGPAALRPRFERLSILRPGSIIDWGKGAGTVQGWGEHGELIVLPDNSPTGESLRLYAEDVKIKLSHLA